VKFRTMTDARDRDGEPLADAARLTALDTREQRRRHEVRPGITGWAQVNGRNALTWDEKLALDVWYVDHRSLRLDCNIIGRTVRQVVGGHGVSAPGHETMEPFRGSAQ
jgi:lipopolysaccharide/colanic/teichoic acid biosynthesis glycosyltransferase